MNIVIYTEHNQFPQLWMTAMRARDLYRDAHIIVATNNTQMEGGKEIEKFCGIESISLFTGFWGKLDALKSLKPQEESVLFLEAGVLMKEPLSEPSPNAVNFGVLRMGSNYYYDHDELGRWKLAKDGWRSTRPKISGQRAVCCFIGKDVILPEYLNGNFGEGIILGLIAEPILEKAEWQFLGDGNGRLNQQGMILLNKIVKDYPHLSLPDAKDAIPANLWDSVNSLSDSI